MNREVFLPGCVSLEVFMQFIKTGSTRLNKILGGGFALSRMAHVVGDPSTGKTQLAIETMVNFQKSYNSFAGKVKNALLNGTNFTKIMYCDAEAAFNPDYAEVLGLNLADVEFVQPSDPNLGITLEDYATALETFLQQLPEGAPGLFILDSLDSLPTKYEMETPFEKRERGYGTSKAKLLGEIYKTTSQRLAFKQACHIVISQTRQNVSGYGPKRIFSGGEAPKFYASQRLMLTKKEDLDKTIKGTKTVYGVMVEAFCAKNKVAKPLQKTEYSIVFDYGIDDLRDNLDWLYEIKQQERIPEEFVKLQGGGIAKSSTVPYERILKLDKKAKRQAIEKIEQVTSDLWDEIQAELSNSLPNSKYDDDDDMMLPTEPIAEPPKENEDGDKSV